MRAAAPAPDCPYCGNPAELWRWGHEDYPHPQNLGRVWGCRGCAAWVRCYPASKKRRENEPMGRLADAKLRKLQGAALISIGRLWLAKWSRGCKKSVAKAKGYEWLARQMGMPAIMCDIRQFDASQCQQVIDICAPYFGENRRSDSATAIEGDRHGEQEGGSEAAQA